MRTKRAQVISRDQFDVLDSHFVGPHEYPKDSALLQHLERDRLDYELGKRASLGRVASLEVGQGSLPPDTPTGPSELASFVPLLPPRLHIVNGVAIATEADWRAGFESPKSAPAEMQAGGQDGEVH